MNSDLGLQGRIAVMTGASRGIGLAIVQALVASGVRVIAGDRSSSPELDKLALSKEAGPQGIRANTVSPGPVATDLWLGQGGVAATVSAATGAKPDDVASQAARQMVTGRFTKPSEVADLVVFLASDLAANITGADFAIDGGLIPTW
jgi:NAD(P)-dependent dehydrogenase (short-subunit alcohol dehydrogenase family)